MKRALLLCASHNDLGLIRALKKLGYYVVVTGNRENAPGEYLADKWIKADYSDKELMVKIASEEQIDVVCACCNDFGVYSAAYIAEKLGLPGYDSYETTLLLHNKDRFKELTKELHIESPISENFTELKKALEWVKEQNLPLIVKPTDASAGNGIGRIDNYDEAEKVVKKAFDVSRKKIIVIEPYIEGTQHGFCTYLLNRKVVACCSNNEYSFINPYRVEIDTYPADNWKECYAILVEQIEKIASTLKLKDGIFHLQYIYSGGKPWILEVMRRVLGNMYSVPANKLNGIDWDYWEVKARCGLDCSDFPICVTQKGFFAYKTILAEHNGVIKKISIPRKYKRFLFDKFILARKGIKIEKFENEPIGFLFMKFSSMEEMKKILIDCYENDFVEIE